MDYAKAMAWVGAILSTLNVLRFINTGDPWHMTLALIFASGAAVFYASRG